MTPQRAGQRNNNQHQRENQREHRPSAFAFRVHVQEIDHMDDDLNHGKKHDRQSRRLIASQRIRHHEPERNGP